MKTALSHVCTKLVAALLLFGLSTASIAENVARNKPATQTSTINGGTADLAVDNHTATIAETSNAPGQSWRVDLGGRYRDANIAIYGKGIRPPPWGRLWKYMYGASKVHFLLGERVVETQDVNSSKTSLSPNTPAAALNIRSLPDTIFDSVRVDNVSGIGLTLRDVQIDAQPYVDNRPNVALGKPTFQTSTLNYASSDLAVDGYDTPMSHTLNGPSEYWKVDLLFPYKIETISIVNRRDICCTRRIVGTTVQILSGETVRYSHVIDENDFASNPYLELNVPAGTVGDGIRVLNKPNEYLTLGEVKVNGVYSYPFPVDGAPGAVMSFKSGEFLGQPGLSNGGLPGSAYAMIKGVNDAVNVSPPLSGYGAATITNSASVQNQTLVPNGKNENIAEISTFAFGLAQPTRIKFRAGLDTGKASSLVINGVPITLQMYSQWWEGNWGMLNDIGWTEFVDLPAGNHTFQVYGVENCCSDPQSFQYQIEGGQWTNFSANDPVLAVRAFGDVFFTPDDKTYRSLSTFTLPPKASGGYETLFFKVRARNDAHIKLGCFRNNIDIFYEIVLGGWENQVSVMRPRHNNDTANGNDGARLNTPNILSGNEDRDFWVSTDGATNTIRVGRGTDPTQGQFMSWANPPSFPWTGSDRVPLCFQLRTGWGSTGTWSGIRNTTTVTQQEIANYPSFLATFPPPPGAGVLFDPNWVNQQWTSSNQDPETFRQKLREQAKNEADIAQTFPESTTTLGDILDAFNTLSNSDISQLFHPDIIKNIKLLAQPNSLENNLITGALNKTIVINNTPIPIYSPGTSNQGLDSNPSVAAFSNINSNSNTPGVGSWQTNNEFSVAVQTNALLPLKALTAGTSYAVPFDINIAFGVPLFTLTSASYQHQGKSKLAIDENKLPLKFSAGLTVDALDYINDQTRSYLMRKIMGVSAGGAIKMQVALLCDKQRAGACQVQNIQFLGQLKAGVEVVKAYQYAWSKIKNVYKYFGGSEADLLDDLAPAELTSFLESDLAAIDQTVSAAVTDSADVQIGAINNTIGTFLRAAGRSASLVGANMGDSDALRYVLDDFQEEQAVAADGDPTATAAENYQGERTANVETNNNTSNSIAETFKSFCDVKGQGYRLECTNDAKLDLAIGLLWANNDTLNEDSFITGYDFHSSPDALKASFTLRLTPGWEARLDDIATFKVRIIPAWTHSFLYMPLTTLGLRASPIMTSEDE